MKVELSEEQIQMLKRSFSAAVKVIDNMDVSDDKKIEMNIQNSAFLQALHDAEAQDLINQITRGEI